jgi:hypothetical protein
LFVSAGRLCLPGRHCRPCRAQHVCLSLCLCACVPQSVGVSVVDLAYPRWFQLPDYGGLYYIWVALVMGFLWMWSNGLILFVIVLVWVRRRRMGGARAAATVGLVAVIAKRG